MKVKFTLEQVTKAHGGVEVWLYFSFNIGAKWGWVVNATPGRLTPEKDPVPIVQEAGNLYKTQQNYTILNLSLVKVNVYILRVLRRTESNDDSLEKKYFAINATYKIVLTVITPLIK
jgi:hypothetical protein